MGQLQFYIWTDNPVSPVSDSGFWSKTRCEILSRLDRVTENTHLFSAKGNTSDDGASVTFSPYIHYVCSHHDNGTHKCSQVCIDFAPTDIEGPCAYSNAHFFSSVSNKMNHQTETSSTSSFFQA